MLALPRVSLVMCGVAVIGFWVIGKNLGIENTVPARRGVGCRLRDTSACDRGEQNYDLIRNIINVILGTTHVSILEYDCIIVVVVSRAPSPQRSSSA